MFVYDILSGRVRSPGFHAALLPCVNTCLFASVNKWYLQVVFR